ncbi:MAG: hypothetical protein IT173_16260 [Acidobacteria bacterium]|nr:hypothetical protein [Acidobacteriota bacterium]
MALIPIKAYRDFWDFPRIFLVELDGTWYLFDCPFNNEREDFEEWYEVSSIPKLPEEELAGSWVGLADRTTQFFGEMLVESITFDPTRRCFIDDGTLLELMNRRT